MVGLLLHVLYYLGKSIYNRYCVKKTLLPDVANEDELFEQLDDTFDDVSELENTSWWQHRTINNFFPPAYMQRYSVVMDMLQGRYAGKLYKVLTLYIFLLRRKCTHIIEKLRSFMCINKCKKGQRIRALKGVTVRK